MGGWLNPSILFIMIRNLITATLIASLPLNTNNHITTANEYINTSNYYEDAIYENEELESSTSYKTIQYSLGRIGTQFTTKARGIQQNTREIPEKIYIMRQYIVITYENIAELNLQYIVYRVSMNIPNQDKINSTNFSWYEYTNELNEYASDLIDGTNYETLTEIRTAFYRMTDDATYRGALTESNQFTTDSDQILLFLQIEYDGDLINDNGAFMSSNILVNSIIDTVTYVLPDVTNYEVIDIPGLMFTVLGMPFAWISIAFNFTIFPGTPYALNISHLVLAVIVAGIAIFIIKKILK